MRCYLACLLVTLLLGARAKAEPFEDTPIHEIPPGPDLLSGEDGDFVLYSR